MVGKDAAGGTLYDPRGGYARSQAEKIATERIRAELAAAFAMADGTIRIHS